MKDGRKGDGTGDPYSNSPINKDSKICDWCGGELVKMETTLGEDVFSDNTGSYKDMYWVNICTRCRKVVRVLEHKVKVGEPQKDIHGNKIHKLRET